MSNQGFEGLADRLLVIASTHDYRRRSFPSRIDRERIRQLLGKTESPKWYWDGRAPCWDWRIDTQYCQEQLSAVLDTKLY